KMPTIRLDEGAKALLLQNQWEGNIRQLRNVTEQISVLEKKRSIDAETLRPYLPKSISNLPAVISHEKKKGDFSNEREILYKVLFDMKNDINDLKKLTLELMENDDNDEVRSENKGLIQKIYGEEEQNIHDHALDERMEILQVPEEERRKYERQKAADDNYPYAEEIEEEETLSLQDKEIEFIKKALE